MDELIDELERLAEKSGVAEPNVAIILYSILGCLDYRESEMGSPYAMLALASAASDIHKQTMERRGGMTWSSARWIMAEERDRRFNKS